MEDSCDHHMAHDEHHEIGRKIVRPMMMELLLTGRAVIIHLEERSEESAFATSRASAKKPPYEIGQQGSRSLRNRHVVLGHWYTYLLRSAASRRYGSTPRNNGFKTLVPSGEIVEDNFPVTQGQVGDEVAA